MKFVILKADVFLEPGDRDVKPKLQSTEMLEVKRVIINIFVADSCCTWPYCRMGYILTYVTEEEAHQSQTRIAFTGDDVLICGCWMTDFLVQKKQRKSQ